MSEKICLRRYRLQTPLGKPRTVLPFLFLTDLHAVSGVDQEFWKMIDKANPCGVFLGGDLFVARKGYDTDAAEKFVKKLSGKYPVWYANGNHERRLMEQTDQFGKSGKRYERSMEGTRAIRLVNREHRTEIRGLPLTVYGLDLPEAYYRKGLRRRDMIRLLEETFGEPDRNRYTVLLAHTPRFWREYLEWGADLTLSGHYHGGVCQLGKHLGLVTPDYRLFVPECCGLRSRGEKHQITSAGAGEHTIPIRIHNPREITLIELETGKG